jgi:hypothetical protein
MFEYIVEYLDAALFRKTLALLLAIENRRSKKRTHDGDDDDDDDDGKTEQDTKTFNSNDTTTIFKSLSKRLKHDQDAVGRELTEAYERFVPER